MSGFLALMNAAPGDIDKLSNAIANCDGTAENMAAIMQDNLNGQLTSLKSKVQETAITIGEMLMPKVQELVGNISGFADSVNNMSEKNKQIMVDIALIVAALGPMLIIFGQMSMGLSSIIGLISQIVPIISLLVGSIGGTTGALGGLTGALALLTGPAGLVIAAITAIIAIITALYLKCDDFRNYVNTRFSELLAFIQQFFQDILSAAQQFWSIVQPLISLWLQVMQGLISVNIEAIKIGIQLAINNIVSIIQIALSLINNIVNFVLGTIESVIKGIMLTIQGIIDLVLGIISGDWDRAWHGILEILGGIVESIGGVIYNLVSFLTNIFSDLIDIAVSWGKDFVQGLINGILSMVSAVGNAAEKIANKIKSILHFSRPDEGPLRNYEEWMPDFVGRMAEQIKQQKSLIADAVTDLATSLNISGMVLENENNTQGNSSNTQINFNGNYNFKDKTDVDYFMNQAALKLVTER